MDRTFKEISIDGLVPFAFGGTGECYRLDEDEILKLHYSGYNPERVIQEKANSIAAIRNDIPTALSYELVRVGDRIGIIYEMIDAKDVSTEIRKDRSRTTELGIKFARLAKDVHRNIDDKGQFPKVTRFIRDSINRIDYVSEKAKDRMLSIIDGLDEYHNFLHGDFHTNNALVTDKGLFLIDMVGFASGCPVFDVATLYFSFFSSPDAFEGGGEQVQRA